MQLALLQPGLRSQRGLRINKHPQSSATSQFPTLTLHPPLHQQQCSVALSTSVTMAMVMLSLKTLR